MCDTVFPIITLLLFTIGVSFGLVKIVLISKISKNTARHLEIIGYCFLFAFIIWQFIIKNILSKQFYERDFYYIHQKLDAISKLLMSDSDKELNEYYDYYRTLNKQMDNAHLSTQLFLIDIFEAALTLGSTILIALGRFHELLSKSGQMEHPVPLPTRKTLRAHYRIKKFNTTRHHNHKHIAIRSRRLEKK